MLAFLDVVLRWLHLATAAAWVGGLMLLGFVVVPLLKRNLDFAQQARMLRLIGGRMNIYSVVVLGLLVSTGVYTASKRLSTLDALFTTPYGNLLLLKMAVVLVILILTALHSLVLGPSIGKGVSQYRTDASQIRTRVKRKQRLLKVMSTLNFALNLLVLAIATVLAHG